MDYTYINNARPYPSSTLGEFDAYPSRIPAIEQEILGNFGAFTNSWGMGSEPVSLTAEASFRKCDHRYDQSPYFQDTIGRWLAGIPSIAALVS